MDKEALLPGQMASKANITGFDGGINGMMIDVHAPAGDIAASDFAFRVGTSDDPIRGTCSPRCPT